jgi:uncharacterized FlaG/YvyC family protein
MSSIDATGGQVPVVGVPEPPRKTDGPAHILKTPPALAEAPGQAVHPPQAGEDTGAARAQMDQVAQLAERLSRESAQQGLRSNRRVRFQVDPGTQELIVQVIDADTQQVVRQFPAADVVERMKNRAALKGLFVNGSV